MPDRVRARTASWPCGSRSATPRPESRYVIFSSTKPVVASAMWMLMGEGAIDVSPPRGRARARVRHERQGRDHHRAGDAAHVGLPACAVLAARLGRSRTPARALRAVAVQLGAGTRFEYHPTSAHWVLAELIERVTGSDFRDFVRTRVIEPLGWPGSSSASRPTQQGDINDARAHRRAGDARRARSGARHPRAAR